MNAGELPALIKPFCAKHSEGTQTKKREMSPKKTDKGGQKSIYKKQGKREPRRGDKPALTQARNECSENREKRVVPGGRGRLSQGEERRTNKNEHITAGS